MDISVKNRINSLNGLRGMACLWVFLAHIGIVAFDRFGSLGVSVFIILSGFLMVYSYLDNNRIYEIGIAQNFLFALKKIKKLYILHIFMIIVSIPLLIMNNRIEPDELFVPHTIIRIILCLLLLQSYVPDLDVVYSINGVAWYLSDCLLFYFIFPWIFKIIKKYKTNREPLMFCIILIVVRFISAYFVNVHFVEPSTLVWFSYIFPVIRLLDFIIGCNLGYIFMRMSISANNILFFSILELIAILVSFFGMWLYVKEPAKIMGITPGVIWIIPACMIIFVTAINKGIFTKLLCNGFFYFFAGISAEMFLIHQKAIGYIQLLVQIVFGEQYIKNVVTIIIELLVAIIMSKAWIMISKRKKMFV
ncbi:acyltransferase family protein [Butyrivibrio sp. LC3010]|uniref:acyltransferase family protein n=1 Tax=Butyrivibrio sp. LC3010 TaxID=1280680 RepID=UPI00040594D5|nr:acyltransferase [Butyrivibrio sp. LC3010]